MATYNKYIQFFICCTAMFASEGRLRAQAVLEWKSPVFCPSIGEAASEDLYAYPIENDTFDLLLRDIMGKMNSTVPIALHWSNVETTTTVKDGEEYHVLYSRRYLLPLLRRPESRPLAVALMAHAAGHCANEHRLKNSTVEEEETEADEFAGYVLALMGFSYEEVKKLFLAPDLPVESQNKAALLRNESIKRGYQRADTALRNSQHASYYENNPKEVLKSFPVFALPPPKWSADADLSDYFQQCKTLYDAERIIRNAMDATGYHSRRYFQTPQGFALVSRLEQFNEDGSCKPEADRWKTKPVGSETFSLSNYLYALFVPQPGYFRIIVFVVTPQTFNADAAHTISREEAGRWLDEGRNRLPEAIGQQAFQKGATGVSALIYEFMARESDKKLTFREVSPLQGLTHLAKSKLLDHLR